MILVLYLKVLRLVTVSPTKTRQRKTGYCLHGTHRLDQKSSGFPFVKKQLDATAKIFCFVTSPTLLGDGQMEVEACAVCMRPANQRCSGCHVIYYCSRDHQKSDWKLHRGKCVPFKVVLATY
uniref:MYND-type domain-containing protein n=1 Tax=Timema genevievae TaxID=629358 RepID=A0A7R9JXB6_TIMGE|nr:unnamed protein product [Timema genevievae]